MSAAAALKGRGGSQGDAAGRRRIRAVPVGYGGPRKPSGAPRGRAAPPAGQIGCTSPELDFGRHGAPRPLVSRGRSRELVYRGTVAYHVGAERQGAHSPPPLVFAAGDGWLNSSVSIASQPSCCRQQPVKHEIGSLRGLDFWCGFRALGPAGAFLPSFAHWPG